MSNAWSVSKGEGILRYGVWFTGKEGDRQLICCPVDLDKIDVFKYIYFDKEPT